MMKDQKTAVTGKQNRFSFDKRFFLALASLILLAPMGPSLAESGETLGPGDGIRVTVFDNPELTTEARISSQGTIGFPLLGDVKLGGLTPGAAVSRIAKKLKDGNFVLNPQVSINVTQVRSRQVSVLGQVVHPGRYALDEGTARLTDLLALAGGIATGGDDVVTVMSVRNGKTERVEIDVPQIYRTGDQASNIVVGNGDTIFVRRAPVFYIYGEVQHAGAYRAESGLNVMQALSLGGGVTPRGTERGMKIHRTSADGVLHKLDAKSSDPVLPNDIIYIQESFF